MAGQAKRKKEKEFSLLDGRAGVKVEPESSPRRTRRSDGKKLYLQILRDLRALRGERCYPIHQ